VKKITIQFAMAFCAANAFAQVFAGGIEIPPAPEIIPGWYFGLGASWNTLIKRDNVTVTWTQLNTFPPNTVFTGDVFNEFFNFAAPIAQLGYWIPISDENWLFGIQAAYKYLGMTSQGNGTFLLNISSINVLSTYITALNKVEHEVIGLVYFGKHWGHNLGYFGLGPGFVSVNSIIRNPTVISNSVTVAQSAVQNQNVIVAQTVTANLDLSSSKPILGAAAQLGYSYYFTPTWFFNVNYTYFATGYKTFTNSITQSLLNSINNTVSSNLIFNRKINVRLQEFMISVNKVL